MVEYLISIGIGCSGVHVAEDSVLVIDTKDPLTHDQSLPNKSCSLMYDVAQSPISMVLDSMIHAIK